MVNKKKIRLDAEKMAGSIEQGLVIPECCREFVILPDETTIRFETTGVLAKYLDEEIEAWKDRDSDIQGRYAEAKTELERIVREADEDGLNASDLQPVRRLLAEGEITEYRIKFCINSQSKLGRLLIAYSGEDYSQSVYWAKASAACCIAMGYDVFRLEVDGSWMLAVADAAVRFRSMEAVSDDILSYKRELKSLTEIGQKQKIDYDSRIADFESKKVAFDEDRKKQFEGDKTRVAEHLKLIEDNATQFEQNYKNRIEVLEETYTKLLQLKGPAGYWDELAKSYRKRGWWLLGAVGLIGGVVFSSLLALLLDCDELPLLNHVKFDAATVRASLIFIVLTSVAGYLLHLFTRLSISSFHLARDYRERFQLTRVYLALIKDGDIQNEESTRQIILQSIFSRSDTGLLKGDHALTMPGVGELVKGNG